MYLSKKQKCLIKVLKKRLSTTSLNSSPVRIDKNIIDFNQKKAEQKIEHHLIKILKKQVNEDKEKPALIKPQNKNIKEVIISSLNKTNQRLPSDFINEITVVLGNQFKDDSTTMD